VQHIRQAAQTYLPAPDSSTSSRRHAHGCPRSAHIWRWRRQLKPGGWALVTLKLPRQGMDKVAWRLDLLRRHLPIAGARPAFHNRLEITVALKGIALPPG